MAACRPAGLEIGGGGSNHQPPAQVIYGSPTELQLELSVWGEGAGSMSQRWKDARCHYRSDTEEQFHTVSMRIEREEPKRVSFTCQIPAIIDPRATSVSYYFDLLFDGHYTKREEKPLPIRK